MSQGPQNPYVELMQRYCDGDAQAFRDLYREVAPKLRGYLARIARNPAVADDLLQQTFLKVHGARAAYIRGADPLPWIFSIAHRTFIDDVRRSKRAIVKVATGDSLPEVSAGITGQTEGQTDEPRADLEQTGAAMAALAALPEQQRQAVVLTKLNGKSIAEAAEIAGTTPGAMKVRAHRGYEALRRVLGGRVV